MNSRERAAMQVRNRESSALYAFTCSPLVACVAVVFFYAMFVSSAFGQLNPSFSEENTTVPTPVPTLPPGVTPTPGPTPEPTLAPYVGCLRAARINYQPNVGDNVFTGDAVAKLDCLQRLLRDQWHAKGIILEQRTISDYTFKCGNITLNHEAVDQATWAGGYGRPIFGGIDVGALSQSERDRLNFELSGISTWEVGKSCEYLSGSYHDNLQVFDKNGNAIDYNPIHESEFDDGIYYTMRQHDGFIDEDCNFYEGNEGAQMCSEVLNVGYRASPISLIWDIVEYQRQREAQEQTVTRFPVSPAQAGELFTWKGSNAMPLVVYDPAHTGKIDSARQLFGNFTFGKQWGNGYEALATLDTDGSGAVDGAELEPLGIWFDRDRDGRAGAGEVVTAKSAGIHALYFNSVERDEATGDLVVSRGFDFDQNGERLSGPSVDWFSTVYSSLAQAVTSAGVAENSLGSTKDRAPGKSGPASGVWFWADAGQTDSQKVDGMLVLRQEGEKLVGRSFIIIPLEKNSLMLKSYMMGADIVGSVERTKAGRNKLTFTVTDSRGRKTESSALLESNGSMLGSSIAEVVPAGSATRQTLRYGWKAIKFQHSS